MSHSYIFLVTPPFGAASILVERAQEFAEEHEINIGALKTTLRSVLIFFKGMPVAV